MLVYSENKFQYLWNIAVTICASFMALYIPLNLVFKNALNSDLKLFYWVATIVFFVDLCVNIYRVKKKINRDKSNLSWGYKQIIWLLIDLVAAIPFSAIFGLGPVWLIQMIKLIRVQQYMHLLKRAEVKHTLQITLVFFCFWIIHLVHWLCCGWISILGIDPSTSMSTNYISSLYWIVTTLTSVGYGDIVPVTNGQRLYAILIQITGIGTFGYLIGNVVSILSKKDPVSSRYIENVEHLTTTLKRRDLPQNLQKRILSFYSYLRDEKMGYDESAFLQSLPDSLKNEVAFNLKKDFIEGIHLFQNASEKFIYEVALKLELVVAIPGEYIFRMGDPGDDMFFIISGELEVLNEEEDQLINILKEGDFFGEIALLHNQVRTASVRAISYCNLYILKRKIFKEMISKHPDVVVQIEDTARARENENP